MYNRGRMRVGVGTHWGPFFVFATWGVGRSLGRAIFFLGALWLGYYLVFGNW
jgi:hypothetical protein